MMREMMVVSKMGNQLKKLKRVVSQAMQGNYKKNSN